MALLDGREQRIIFLTEDDLMELLGQGFDADGGFRPDKSPREIMQDLNPNFLQGDFKVYVPLNGKIHHSQVEEDTGSSMIDCNSVIKLGHRLTVIACDAMFIALTDRLSNGRYLGLRVTFCGELTSFGLDTIDDVQESGQVPLYFGKSLNWQGEHIAEDAHQALIDWWETSPRAQVRDFTIHPVRYS